MRRMKRPYQRRGIARAQAELVEECTSLVGGNPKTQGQDQNLASISRNLLNLNPAEAEAVLFGTTNSNRGVKK